MSPADVFTAEPRPARTSMPVTAPPSWILTPSRLVAPGYSEGTVRGLATPPGGHNVPPREVRAGGVRGGRVAAPRVTPGSGTTATHVSSRRNRTATCPA